MGTKNFKRLRKQTIPDPLDPSKMIAVRRWKTLVDLPKLGVLKGDLTGFIDNSLGPEKDEGLWVDYDAIVYGTVIAQGFVCVLNNAIVRGPDPKNKFHLYINGNVTISESAIVAFDEYNEAEPSDSTIKGEIVISGFAKVGLPEIMSGKISIQDHARVDGKATFLQEVKIYDNAKIGNVVTLNGHSIHVHENASIGPHVEIKQELNLDGDTVIMPESYIANGVLKQTKNRIAPKKLLHELPSVKSLTVSTNDVLEDNDMVAETKPKMPESSSRVQRETFKNQEFWFNKLCEIKNAIDEYETDIVKILKYPVMVDLTNPYTSDMIFALKDVEIAINIENYEEIPDAITQLERKFVIAESNARRVTQTALTKDELESTQQARDLFALACNESATENEKSMALKRGFKRLEGIIAVPDKAIHAMTIKAGLAELEM